MPYPNEHACRLEDPGKYDKLRRDNCGQKHEGKCIDVIYGIKDGKSEVQALRYKKDIWDEDDARAHCKSRKGKFEPAGDEEENNMTIETDTERAGIIKRAFDLDSIEIRTEDGGAQTIRGHAAVFNKRSVELQPGFYEVIEPGAFSSAVKRDDVRALFNHDMNYILGRTKSGTLTLEEDEKGLFFVNQPPDTQYARDLIVSIERGDISQCSFAFNIDGKKGERWEVDGKEVDWDEAFMAMFDTKKHDVVRYVLKARLYDVSPVVFPAFPQTDVKARAALAAAGINYDALTDAMVKAQLGGLLNDKEKTTLVKASDKIRSYIAAGDKPGERGAPAKGRADSLAKARLRFRFPKNLKTR